MQKNNVQTSDINPIFTKMGFSVVSVERIGGGRNSRVYLLVCKDCKKYIAKFYFTHRLDKRDRLEVEFASLQFLWNNGIKCVPQPVLSDKNEGCAIYEYIEGEKVASQDVTNDDIECVVEFLGRLKKLGDKKESDRLPNASEAFFSNRAIVTNIRGRLEKLYSICNDKSQYNELHRFLDDFRLLFSDVVRWCKLSLEEKGMSFVSCLGREDKTLSPSDFGFHNALRRKSGQIAFLDFEYFGWDDPAKMISDFLLHPNMELKGELKNRFVDAILKQFKEHVYLRKRLEIVYPLFGLKWCLILLNEFLPEQMLRRKFATGDSSYDSVLSGQLTKSRKVFDKISKEYEKFPY